MKFSRIDLIGLNGPDGEIYHHLHKHGHRPKTGSSPTYSTWCCMKSRCFDENHESYKYYGALGISVCDRWLDFISFLADMGDRPDGCTIDRIDPTLGYFKENCRWATQPQQGLNRKSTSWIEFHGFIVPIAELARCYGLPRTTIKRRYAEGLKGDALVSSENRNQLRTGSRCPSSKLTEEMVSKIKKMLGDGVGVMKIARWAGVSGPTISGIKSGATWALVEAAQ